MGVVPKCANEYRGQDGRGRDPEQARSTDARVASPGQVRAVIRGRSLHGRRVP